MHIWWARRPLAASRFALLGSLVRDDWTHQSTLQLLGIPEGKDPVALRMRIDEANKRGERLKVAYGYDRAFKNPIPTRVLQRFRSACQASWGTERPRVLDPFSGGGSIPFEAVRLGLASDSIELNPVACVVQLASVDFPLRFGAGLATDLKRIGEGIAEKLEAQLTPFFPKQPGETIFGYIWVRSVSCPDCGFDTPLTPNWWLDRGGKRAFRALVEKGTDVPLYVVVKTGEDDFDPDAGSVTRGTGECVRCGQPVEGDYIKAEAQAGRMGHQLAAIGYKMQGRKGRHFRLPSAEDFRGFEAAKQELERRWPEWEAQGFIPTEERYIGPADRSANYGVTRFYEMFNLRQLLVHLTTLEAIRNNAWDSIPDLDRRRALRTLVALAMDKGLDYNSIQSRLHASRGVIVNTFDRHDFSFKWNYGEIDGAGQLFRWGVSQVVDAYKGCAELLSGAEGTLELRQADARDLSQITDESVHAVITDPPYYANVMYAELSDFFYVWLRRAIGDLYPDWFRDPLVDKESEAVANAARFRGLVKGKGSAHQAAHDDYELKMTQAWREAHRVLVPGGVLTIMFNHKQLEAWDALARSIIEAGFTITASWAVSTESEYSLHIREKQAVQRTIFLVARKMERGAGAWWEDVRKEMRAAIQEKLKKVIEQTPHVSRIDLLMSAYGEGLRVLSQHWPVRDSRGGNIKISQALTQARATLQDWYFEARLGHRPDFDTETKVVLYALEGYGAREAAYDDIRLYGMALGLDVQELYRSKLAERKRAKVWFLGANERLGQTSRVDPDREEYALVWDRIQAAAIAFGEKDAAAFRRWLREKGFLANRAFLDACAFLAQEAPSDLLETKMARSVASFAPSAPRGQQTLDDLS